MSDFFKLGSRKIELPGISTADSEKGDWVFESRAGGMWLAIHRITGERKRFYVAEKRGELSFSVRGHLFHGKIERKTRGSDARGSGGDSDLISQFPGKVRKVLAQAGQKVAEGDALLLVEAMKMEFTIRAPYAGTLSAVLVVEGQQLAPGTRFLDLIPEKGEENGT